MKLPIEGAIPELLHVLAVQRSAVLQAPPGAGKTTRVPLALLDAPWLGQRRIVMLEPRRIAARSAARFMAAQLGEAVGRRVGYRMRQDTRVGSETRIEVVTEGVLTRLLQEDPELGRYGIVIFDEFHERNLQADLGLSLVLEARAALREDLRVLVMSATLDAGPVAELLGNAAVITSQGRSFDVDIRYVPAARVAPGAGMRPGPGHSPGARLAAHTAAVIGRAMAEEGGSALVFLPGQREIRQVQQALSGQLPGEVLITPLYGNLSQAEQDAAVQPAATGRRKLVLATNIAETSLTIEGIRLVVDAGLERRARFDPVSGMTRLITGSISQASATQRAGRAGRLEPGVCYRLWASSEHDRLARRSIPEILEADLAPLVLELAQWGASSPDQLAWLDPPPGPAWAQARQLLMQLDALDPDGRLTAHGRGMQALAVHPRLAHMLLRARALDQEAGGAGPGPGGAGPAANGPNNGPVNRQVNGLSGWTGMACELAVLLSERDIGRGPGPPGQAGQTGQRQTDLALRLRLLQQGREGRLKALRQEARSLLQRLSAVTDTGRRDGQGHSSDDSGAAHAAHPGVLLGFAYPDRLARRRQGQAPRYLLANGRGACLDVGDELGQSEFLVAAELDGDAREARVYLAADLDRAALERYFGDAVVKRDVVEWDDASQAVIARHQRQLGALVLDDAPMTSPSPELMLEGLLDAIRSKGLEVLPWDEATRQWRGRVALMHGLEPERWPAVTDDALLAELEAWAAPFLHGLTRFSQLRRMPLQTALGNWLGYQRQHRLDQLAPLRWQVPSGSRVQIDYTSGEAPVLAVKLQELFGEARTPCIADGRVALLLHLLSPARRPVQITRDLAGFWAGSYAEVRKDLRGRYPKHPWPEDPATAVPTRHAKPRGK